MFPVPKTIKTYCYNIGITSQQLLMLTTIATVLIFAIIKFIFLDRWFMPRADVSTAIIMSRYLGQNTFYLKVETLIENHGNVPIEIKNCEVRLEWIVPLKYREKLVGESGFSHIDLITQNTTESRYIETKETDRIYTDFYVDLDGFDWESLNLPPYNIEGNPMDLSVYVYIKNAKAGRGEFGWQATATTTIFS